MHSDEYKERRHQRIVAMAGKKSAEEIAAAVGFTPNTLRYYCSKNKISLRLNADPQASPRAEKAKTRKRAPSPKTPPAPQWKNTAKATGDWKDLVPLIKSMAGRSWPPESIARALEITEDKLERICTAARINLATGTQDPDRLNESALRTYVRKKGHDGDIDRQLEDASALLRQHGYTVLMPDPFRTGRANQ